MDGGGWWVAVHGVAKSRTWLSDFTFTFHFHALEKEMATHSSVLVWRIPRTGEPGGLLSMGLHRVGHDWSDLVAAAAAETNSWLWIRLLLAFGSSKFGLLLANYFNLHFPLRLPKYMPQSVSSVSQLCPTLCDPMECISNIRPKATIILLRILFHAPMIFSGLSRWLSGNESTCQCRRHSLIPGSGRFPGEGNDTPL